jgi:hypothetical protein
LKTKNSIVRDGFRDFSIGFLPINLFFKRDGGSLNLVFIGSANEWVFFLNKLKLIIAILTEPVEQRF